MKEQRMTAREYRNSTKLWKHRQRDADLIRSGTDAQAKRASERGLRMTRSAQRGLA